jgi:hypothetical protein
MKDKANLSGWSVDRVKVNKSFSQETLCFRAEVLVNGLRVGNAFNEGHGGSTHVVIEHEFQKDVTVPAGLADHVDALVADVQAVQDLQRTYKRWVKQIMAGKVFALRADEDKAWEAGTDHQETSAPPFRVYSARAVADKHLAGVEHALYDERNLNALWQKLLDGHYKWKALDDARTDAMLKEYEEKLKARSRIYNEPPASPQMPDGY